jgi:hypothetical protein
MVAASVVIGGRNTRPSPTISTGNPTPQFWFLGLIRRLFMGFTGINKAFHHRFPQ